MGVRAGGRRGVCLWSGWGEVWWWSWCSWMSVEGGAWQWLGVGVGGGWGVGAVGGLWGGGGVVLWSLSFRLSFVFLLVVRACLSACMLCVLGVLWGAVGVSVSRIPFVHLCCGLAWL